MARPNWQLTALFSEEISGGSPKWRGGLTGLVGLVGLDCVVKPEAAAAAAHLRLSGNPKGSNF